MNIVIVAFDDFTDLDVFMPWDLISRVKRVMKRDDWNVKIIGTKPTHVSTAGLEIPMHAGLDALPAADAVVISSGPGIQRLIADADYLSKLSINPRHQRIGSMCSGSLLLGAKGLLKGKKATTYPTAVKQLAQFGVEVVNESFVLVGNIATAAGCLAAQQLSWWIIKELAGESAARQVLDSVQPVS
ncbi:DJ-1/PfpI family protein [Paenibacillus thermotolerans]|uniref:DJ-1/PfpI family protein n=1 Tax=Paenibacillus thermotolerans TaxID=3027807 RepID=UPI0023685FE0|nr:MULTISPECIES: DJ-1/PfpI family protein [unclassified Paenibacillus]